MLILLSAVLSTLGSMFRSRAVLEDMAPRHQIGVLKRSARSRGIVVWERKSTGTTQTCLAFAGTRPNEAVANAILRAIEPNAIEAAIAAVDACPYRKLRPD